MSQRVVVPLTAAQWRLLRDAVLDAAVAYVLLWPPDGTSARLVVTFLDQSERRVVPANHALIDAFVVVPPASRLLNLEPPTDDDDVRPS